MKIKTQMRYHLILVSLAIIKTQNISGGKKAKERGNICTLSVGM